MVRANMQINITKAIEPWASQDQALLLANLPTLLERKDKRRGVPIRQTSLEHYLVGYTRIDRALLELGHRDSAVNPSQRITPAILLEVIDLLGREGVSKRAIGILLYGYERVLRAIDDQGAALNYLNVYRRRECRSPRIPKGALPSRKEVRTCAIDEIDAARQLGVNVVSALKFRNGLQLLLLEKTGLRVRNLAALRLGSQATIVERAPGWFVKFSGAQTKNWVLIDRYLDKEAVKYLFEFFDVYRPLLCAQSHRGSGGYTGHNIWVSHRGGEQGINSIYKSIVELTERRLGLALSPHRIRAVIATSIARETPNQADKAVLELANTYNVMCSAYRAGGMLEAVQAANRKLESFYDGLNVPPYMASGFQPTAEADVS